MNKIPTRLNKEPLIEAIWQAQFEPKDGLPVGDLLPGILYSALKVDHPNLQLHRLPTADIPAPVAQIDPSLRFSAKYRMEEPGSPFLFQVGDRIVTMNCRKPYAGWSAFKERMLKLINVIESSGLVPTPRRHSLRYIDLLCLDQAPSPPESSFDPLRSSAAPANRPGEDFNRRTSWPEVLEPHGWTRLMTRNGVTYWRRPGKAHGVSATTGYAGTDYLYVFSSSTALDNDRAYTKFGVYALLDHGGDFRAATTALGKAGYGEQPRKPNQKPHLQ